MITNAAPNNIAPTIISYIFSFSLPKVITTNPGVLVHKLPVITGLETSLHDISYHLSIDSLDGIVLALQLSIRSKSRTWLKECM